ncbi:uncharacterized protein B0H18DRAFT_949903 [Fomitopsis serialis]|uniref:uncharacterized protein n=1 Tax=Fomitopsis serialis TaxID=139415 RepID=UPI0020080DBE|nr:uncharacterized protein B0H18DRAFT_949903 [Neoantrodia serialis]KAH9938622.1 hypothetical protein B0H18DRAFT_949903 [Neoantrodia serialis]
MSATPLFRDRTVRAVTSDTYNLMQSSVAMLALASLSILVVMHHRRNGQFLTQTQEEIILIAAFGFFWLGQSWGTCADSEYVSGKESERRAGRREQGFTSTRRYGCRDDSWYCVVEEYSWY